MDNDVLIVDVNQNSPSRTDSHASTEFSPSISSRNSASSFLSSPSNEYTPKKIEILLKQQGHKYTVVDNIKAHSSKCWELFGFPALVESKGEPPRIIEKFVTCRICFTTYSFNSNSTRLLNNHTCQKSHRARSSSASVTSSSSSKYHQTNLTSYGTGNLMKFTDL